MVTWTECTFYQQTLACVLVLVKCQPSISSMKMISHGSYPHLHEAVKGNLTANKPTLPGTPSPWDLGDTG